ncbi:aldehyde dehydrogenase family protein [Nocardia flavorosea]|uniref:Aldehyde dehydrogenase family protein n=1 Tax=Nocardia flavorosea TaxID=53429 RepID=A0A846YH51_9NOCA|nr:aldehyde dehydrogenase family protein [Nocardia flavorosea]NKY56962.1 aldehyde dehydrogenase family protein [Nocardia flavorosea]
MADTAQPEVAARSGGSGRPSVLTSYDPRTGEIVGNYPIAGPGELERTVAEARAAESWWSTAGFGPRKRLLLEWKRVITRRAGQLVEILREETGKPEADAAIEVMLAVENLDWAARNAGRVLGRRTLASNWLTRNQHASVGYLPLGVVGVLGPWQNPVFTPMGSIAYAMAAGNAVVFKPHELTSGTGLWLASTWREVAPGKPVLSAVSGDDSTAAALCRAGVDKIAYAGPEAPGREVISLCAQTMTPVVVENSGKGAMIVHVDAKIDDAAEAAVFGAMANAGQNATGVQRAYVAASIYDQFLDLVVDRARALRPGADRRSSYGPMILESQTEVVRKQVRDALARGGRAVVGGLDSIREPYVEPIVLADVPEESIAITEEGIGPVLIVNKVRDLDDAVTRINDAGRGIAVSVFTRDIAEVEIYAERLRAGVVTVNTATTYASIPALPFGGVGEYGQGHSHGDLGLREFSRTLSIARNRYGEALGLSGFYRNARRLRFARTVFRFRHG